MRHTVSRSEEVVWGGVYDGSVYEDEAGLKSHLLGFDMRKGPLQLTDAIDTIVIDRGANGIEGIAVDERPSAFGR